MDVRDSIAREVTMPASVLTALRRALRQEMGSLTTIHTLHAAGYASGEVAFNSFGHALRQPVEEIPEAAFWAAFGRFLDRRGWGKLQHSAPHPGVGLLTSPDWAEAEGELEAQPACAFSVGLLSHLLTRAAGAPVAVLEVSCRARGDQDCTFAFGSDATIHDLYGLLLEGNSLEMALSEL